MTILHLDSSPRAASHSRALSAEAVTQLQSRFPDTSVVYHDLSHEAIPFVSEEWVAAAFSDPSTHSQELKNALALSNILVDELLAADVLVAGVPMYNFSVPASFKAWLDQVARFGRTFTIGADGAKGLLTDRPVLFVTARGSGGYGPGEANESINFEDPYLKTVFAFLGIQNTSFAHINNANEGSPRPASLNEARGEVAKFVASVGGQS